MRLLVLMAALLVSSAPMALAAPQAATTDTVVSPEYEPLLTLMSPVRLLAQSIAVGMNQQWRQRLHDDAELVALNSKYPGLFDAMVRTGIEASVASLRDYEPALRRRSFEALSKNFSKEEIAALSYVFSPMASALQKSDADLVVRIMAGKPFPQSDEERSVASEVDRRGAKIPTRLGGMTLAARFLALGQEMSPDNSRIAQAATAAALNSAKRAGNEFIRKAGGSEVPFSERVGE